MALNTRTIAGYLFDVSGITASNKDLTFTLIDAADRPASAWDYITFERVMGHTEVTTDVNGYFTVDLWPTSRGDKELYYLCESNMYGFTSIKAYLPSASSTITFVEWYALGSSPGSYGSVQVSGASNAISVAAPVGTTNVDSVDAAKFKAVEWIVQLKDTVTNGYSLIKILALNENSVGKYVEYGKIGSLTNYSILISIVSGIMYVGVDNQGPNPMDVIVLRLPMLETI